MRSDEARVLLGFHPNSRPTPAQIKAAYKNKVWESHPDLFPINEKSKAESKFKQVSEAYSCLQSGGSGPYSRVVRTGVPRAHGSRGYRAVVTVRIPFLFIMLGTVGLGGFIASRAYRRQRADYPSQNPFLP